MSGSDIRHFLFIKVFLYKEYRSFSHINITVPDVMPSIKIPDSVFFKKPEKKTLQIKKGELYFSLK